MLKCYLTHFSSRLTSTPACSFLSCPAGRTICKLHLPPGMLHADLNGDGVLDHVSVFHGHTSEGEDADGGAGGDALPGELHVVSSKGHRRLGRCEALATSGIPPTEEVFSVQVCQGFGH